jgi:ACT domain-containing protein
VAEQDKDIKAEMHNNAKIAKRNDVKTEKLKETFEDHFKGTVVDPDFDPNLDLNAVAQLDEVKARQEDENSKSADVSDLRDELIDTGTDFDAEKDKERAQAILEKELQKLRPKNFKVKSTKNRTRYFFLTLTLFLIGFLVGQYYETSSRNTVYVLDEAKFLKLASIGIATSDRDSSSTALSETDLSASDKLKVKDAIVQVNEILSKSYTRYPVLIQKKQKKSYDVYNLARRIDITVPVLIELIGEEKWAEIGKILK